MLYLALRSLWMRRATYTLVFIEIVVGLLSLTLAVGVWDDTRAASRRLHLAGPDDAVETLLVHCAPESVEALAALPRGNPAVAGVGVVYVWSATVRAIGPETAELRPLRVAAGRWFRREDFAPGQVPVVLGPDVHPELSVGSPFAAEGVPSGVVVGRLRRGQRYWTATSNVAVQQVVPADGLVLVPVTAIPWDRAQARLWMLPNPSRGAEARAALDRSLQQMPGAELSTPTANPTSCQYSPTKTIAESLSAYYAAQRPVLYTSGFVAAVVLAVALIGLAGVLMITLEQRSREFALRLAMGATGLDLARQLLWEMLGLFSAALLPGVLGGRALAAPFQLQVSALGFAAVAIIGGLAVLLSVLVPLRVVASKPPVYYIRSGR